MKKILWLAVGVGDVDAKAREFGGAVVDGYKAREAELRAAVADAEDAIADFAKRK